MKIPPEVPSFLRELAAVLCQPKPMRPGVGLRAHHENAVKQAAPAKRIAKRVTALITV
jgi:hypothetical protein